MNGYRQYSLYDKEEQSEKNDTRFVKRGHDGRRKGYPHDACDDKSKVKQYLALLEVSQWMRYDRIVKRRVTIMKSSLPRCFHHNLTLTLQTPPRLASW